MNASSTLRIALLTKYMAWGGGLEFLRYLANGLMTLKNSHSLVLHIVVDEEFERSELYTTMVDFFNVDIPLGENVIRYDGSLGHLEAVLMASHIDLVMPVNADLGANFAVPWMSYIPDFQHKYLYKNFTSEECFVREVAFSARLRDCKVVLVNSRAVKQDIVRFYPWINQDSIFDLPFSPNAPADYLVDKSALLSSMPWLPKQYFLISNQFWIHKNHKTAFSAFAQLQGNNDLALLCTGLMEDYRHGNYLNELKTLINELGLSQRVQLLGHIPKRQQIELMKHAIAVVQPTGFEGGPGGGAVYDAVSLGVPVILSDIEINLEVQGKNIYFFNTQDANSLAGQMQHVLGNTQEKVSKEALVEAGKQNLQRLGARLLDAINFTLALAAHHKN
jgi:glycosyltransferase involved in cell wall biosynthesis